MSNPFLVDLDDNYTPYTSGISTPFSGAATPTTKRRNSTNPFEILSPEGDEPPVTFTLDNEALQSAANEINNNNNSSQQPQENVASTIADMTADFYQAITKHDFNFDATINDDVFEEQQSGRGLQDDILGGDDHEEEDEYEEDNNNFEHQLNKPVTTVKTINYDEEESHGGGVSSSSALFDPFETIHDDDGMSSKRSSVEVSGITPLVSTTGASSSNQTVTELASSLVSANSAKAKELFNSSMASFELLAAGGKPAGKDDDDPLGSPMTPTTPPSMEENSAEVGAVAGAAGSAFLTPAPPTTAGMDVYSSNDLSDLSDVSPTTAADVRSAFNMYSEIDKEVLPSKFEPIADSEIIKRQISVTQGGGELEDDEDVELSSKRPLSDIDAAAEGPQKATSAFKHTQQLISSVSGSVDIFDPGNPNQNAEGIVNDAFDEMAAATAKSNEEPTAIITETTTTTTTDEGSRKSSLNLQRKSSLDVVEVDSKNIQPNDLRQLVAPLNQAIEEGGGGNNGSVDQEDALEQASKKADGDGEDPFDTSAFDSDAFDAFESRFEATDLSIGKAATAGDDPFASPYKTAKGAAFSSENAFDSFEPFVPKQPENTPFHQASTVKARPAKAKPAKVKKDSFEDSFDSDGDEDSEEEENIKIVIRAKMKDDSAGGEGRDEPPAIVPLLPPPPKSPRHLPLQLKQSSEVAEGATEEESASANPEDAILMSYRTPYTGIKNKTRKNFVDEEFDRFFNSDARDTDSTGGGTLSGGGGGEEEWPTAFGEAASKSRTGGGGGDSPASPQTPLYDEDTSQPLEEFPARYTGDGWEMMLRHPAKKKLTANRYWKKVWVRFIPEGCILQLFNKREDVQPFQELPLQASYSLSEVCAQQYDQYGKIFTIKVQYIFYRERVGVRPGQIAKVMQGQIQSMGDFARLGMPVEHAPQVSELLKIGSLDWAEVKQLVTAVEEAMFRLAVHRDRALTYRTEEIQCVVQDELYVEQSKIGVIEKQLARVRVFFLAFLNGIPAIEVGVNDLRRQGKEVVGRHDILPVVTEEWIRVEAPEFHACVQSEVFEQSQVVKLIPPDACHFELMRFRIRPPKNRELPLQVSAYMNITASKMELKCDILVPGCISRKHGQIPCEEIAIRFHIPECWIYFFRVEKHFRMGAVHSTNRRSGKLKGFDRFLGTAANPEPQLIEVTAGQAKYEHAYHSIVWRIPRLPKDGQGAYTQQFMIVRLPLSSFDRIPETFYDYVHVEFHMPSTTVSHTTLRSISIAAGGGENPPEKFVRYNAKYEYKIALSITYDDSKPEPEYVAAVALNNGSVKSSSGGGGGGTSETGGHSSEDEDEAVVEAGAGAVAAAVEVAE